MIVLTEKEKYSFYKYLSLIIPETFEKNIDKFFRPSNSVISENKKIIRNSVTIPQLKRYNANIEILTLEVTQNCNLRCKYCAFGGNYIGRRIHNPKKMNFEIYDQALNFFFQLLNSPVRTNRNPISISYYGGEPLLEFENLYRCTKLARNIHSKNQIKTPLVFSVTTNGVLLDSKIVKMLVEEDFITDISLDGSEEEHNKFRVKASGAGSFEDVFFNINNIKENFPEYFSKRIRFYVTIHPNHDIKSLEKFLLSRSDLFNEKNVKFSWVNLRNLKNDSQKSLYEDYIIQTNKIETDLLKDTWVYRKLVSNWLDFIFEKSTQNLIKKLHFTGTCIPGENRIFVDVEGNLHICEKVNADFSIGDVYSGFNYTNIKKIVKNWQEEVLKVKCWECEAWWFCTCCYANRSKPDSERIEFDVSNCIKFVNSCKKECKKFLNILEAEDEIENSNCYSDINCYLDAL